MTNATTVLQKGMSFITAYLDLFCIFKLNSNVSMMDCAFKINGAIVVSMVRD